MKTLTFLILHGIVLLAVLITLLAASWQDNVEPVNLIRLTGAVLIIAVYLFVAELFILAVSAANIPWVSPAIRALWGISLFFLAIYLMVDYKLFQALGGHLDTAVIGYFFSNLRGVTPIILSEISGVSLAVVAAMASGSLALALLGWQAEAHASRLISAGAFIPAAVFLLVVINTNACQFPADNSTSEPQIYVVSLSGYLTKEVAGRQCRAPGIKGARSSTVSSLKLAQLKRGISGSDSFFKDRGEISAAPNELKKSKGSRLKNIVIIALESFRTDAITPYNNKLDTTPFLNRLAREGLMASTAYVDFFHTSKSLIATNCGMPPHPHYTVIENRSAGIPYACLPQLLKPLGYNSAFFQTATKSFENREELASNMGFDDFFSLENIDHSGWEKVNYFGIEDRAMINPIMNWVDEQKNPFFISMVTLTSHHSYNTPASFPHKEYEGSKAWNKYLNTIRYTDAFLEELFSEFDRRGLLDNTLFVLTGDHGVGVGLHDTNYPFQGNIRTPLIIWDKDLIKKPRTVSGPRQHSDIIPTIADLLKLEPDSDNFYGQSLLKKTNDRTLYIACKLNNCNVLVNNEFKYISHSDKERSTVLINLTQKPFDKNNLVHLIPKKVVDRFNGQLDAWRDNVMDIYE